MDTDAKRATAGMKIEIPIEVAGADCLGVHFLDRTRTLAIGRHGGKVVLDRKLVPQQDVTVRCLATGREADARIVGQVGKSGDHHHYGIKFLDKDANIWGIEFPTSAEPEGTVGRVLLQCTGCKDQEVMYLDEFELEVLEVDSHLSHFCKRCRDASLWRRSLAAAEEPAAIASAPPAPTPMQERRREPRRKMSITACVRTARFGDDVVKTRTVSRTGLSFVGSWNYVPGDVIEVAVPYSPAGGNLFMRAKVARIQYLEAESTKLYGIVYQGVKA